MSYVLSVAEFSMAGPLKLVSDKKTLEEYVRLFNQFATHDPHKHIRLVSKDGPILTRTLDYNIIPHEMKTIIHDEFKLLEFYRQITEL